MKNGWSVVIMGLLAVSAIAQEVDCIRVTADRVSLRAGPGLNDVLLDRTMEGDLLWVKDNSKADWVGVTAPGSIDLWVASGFIRDEVVLPKLLNVRSGPSLNHSVVGVLYRDDAVTVRGEAGGWLRIAPPKQAVVWISREYTQRVAPVASRATKSDAVVITIVPPPESRAVPEKVIRMEKVVQPEMNEMMVVAATVMDMPSTLSPDPSKKQGVLEEFSGTLQETSSMLYKLMQAGPTEMPVCYVRGNQKQMSSHRGRSLTITGKTYWATGLDMPFVVPVKIEVLSQ